MRQDSLRQGFFCLILLILGMPSVLIAGQDKSDSGSLAFQQIETSVGEALGKVVILVSRTGGSEGVVSVGVYSTVLGSALGGLTGNRIDFKHVLGTKLVWLSGDNTDKSLEILIFDDNKIESTEEFWLKLRYASGGAVIGEQATHLVKIIDND